MALTIPNYREPGAYSTLVVNPTTVSASGPPIVAIVGQALQGPYEPQLFYSTGDAQALYGSATKSNPLPLGIQIAFENGAPRVIGLNVQPTNSLPAYLTKVASGLPGLPICTQGLNTSSFPTSAFAPAAQGSGGLLDPVTNMPINVDGTVAGVFYIQDYDPTDADPVYNSTPQSTSNAFANAGASLLQYIKYGTAPTVNGQQQVPLSNTPMIRVSVPANQAQPLPATSSYQAGTFGTITQSKWNQFNNVMTLLTALNATPNCPVFAQILVPDVSQTAVNPVVGWREMFSCVGDTSIQPTNSTTVAVTSNYDAYAYAIQSGVLRISALEAGTQHEIVTGLYQVSTFDNQTGTLPFGLPTGFAGSGQTNPYFIFDNGVDGVVTTQSYIDAINNQLTTVRADVVVVLNTDSGLQSTIKSHVEFMSSTDERNERIALVSGPISEQYTTSISNAQALQGGPGAERMVYIWPTGGYRQDAILGTTVTLDGTYLAAACAGILTSNDAATPLTRKVLSGFSDITVKTTRTAMNMIAQNGICIIENNPTQGLRCRDGITCDPTSVESQEISIVRQLDFVAQTVRDLLDANIVATKITANTLAAVTALTTNALQNLVTSGIIYGFQNVTCKIDMVDPRQIDVIFDVRPAYPAKYIQITINVSSSLTGYSTTGNSTANIPSSGGN